MNTPDQFGNCLLGEDCANLAKAREVDELRAEVAAKSAAAAKQVSDLAMQVGELRAENERLREALSDAIALIGHRMPMDTTALVAGEKLVACDVWRAGIAALGEAK